MLLETELQQKLMALQVVQARMQRAQQLLFQFETGHSGEFAGDPATCNEPKEPKQVARSKHGSNKIGRIDPSVYSFEPQKVSGQKIAPDIVTSAERSPFQYQ